MDKKRFLYLLDNYRSLSNSETVELLALQKKFPYSQAIRNITTWGAYHNNLSNKKGQLYIATVYATDRAVLKTIVTAPKVERKAVAVKPHVVTEKTAPQQPPPAAAKIPAKQIAPPPSAANLEISKLIAALPHDLYNLKKSKNEFELAAREFDEHFQKDRTEDKKDPEKEAAQESTKEQSVARSITAQTAPSKKVELIKGTAKKVGRPATKKVDRPATKKVDRPATKKVDRPATKKVGRPAKKKVGRPTTKKVGRPAKKKVGRPVKKKVGRPAKKKVGRPAKKKVGRPVKKKVGRPVKKKVGRPAAKKVGRPVKKKVGRPAAKKVGRPAAKKTQRKAAPKKVRKATKNVTTGKTRLKAPLGKKKKQAKKKSKKNTDRKKKSGLAFDKGQQKNTVQRTKKQQTQFEIIDRFIKTKPTMRGAQPTKGDLIDLSEASEPFGEGTVSETLVQVLVAQKRYQKAIDLLKKLIWKTPQKKAHFMAQIKQLEGQV